MPAFLLIVITLVAFYLAYRFYSRYLAEKVYRLDPNFVTPANELRDGVDFVPTHKHVLLGHHFTSVAGAAPIVGPAIAVYWGWLPALTWVVLGTIFAAGVHDFGSIVVSARNRGQNIGTLSGKVVSARASTLFLLIIFFLLTLVNAVFGVVMAILFEANPGAVVPALIVIPIAVFIGQWAYRMGRSIIIPSIIGLLLLYIAIPIGQGHTVGQGQVGRLGRGLQVRGNHRRWCRSIAGGIDQHARKDREEQHQKKDQDGEQGIDRQVRGKQPDRVPHRAARACFRQQPPVHGGGPETAREDDHRAKQRPVKERLPARLRQPVHIGLPRHRRRPGSGKSTFSGVWGVGILGYKGGWGWGSGDLC